MSLTPNQREANYVRQRLGKDCEYPYGLVFLTPAQLKRMRKKIRSRRRKAGELCIGHSGRGRLRIPTDRSR